MVFVIGQILLRIYIDPVVRMKGTIGETAFTLSKFSHVAHNASTTSEETVSEVFMAFRELSARLRANLHQVPCYGTMSFIFRLPQESKVQEASKNIVAISNWMTTKNNAQTEHVMLNFQQAFLNLGLELPSHETVDEALLKKLIRALNEKP